MALGDSYAPEVVARHGEPERLADIDAAAHAAAKCLKL
jgi:hypothetical protein